MTTQSHGFDVAHTIEQIRHYLPRQSALKDFVHHNTLHAFQSLPFHQALWQASNILGYRTYLSLDEFRELYHIGRIKPERIKKVIQEHINDEIVHGREFDNADIWQQNMLQKKYDQVISTRLFQLSGMWKDQYKINLSKVVQPFLFRILASYLDQGIAQWNFPIMGDSFLSSLRTLEQNGYVSLFKTKRARSLLLENKANLTDLLEILVGNEDYYEHYLFDQQFSHPGWSGFVAVVEHQPETLLDQRKISLEELIYFELLLEIDTLDYKFDVIWKPLMIRNGKTDIVPLFDDVPYTELSTVLQLWQDAYEWSYFDGIIAGIQQSKVEKIPVRKPVFQGLFCIDDRAYSLRRHIEAVEPFAETFGTPGYFGVAFYFQPENGKFVTRACPANVDPAYIIKEINRKKKIKEDAHFHSGSHSLIWGSFISGTLGFWSAFKLFFNLYNPSLSALSVHSFDHADKNADLQIESTGERDFGLIVGFTSDEMAERVEAVLKSIGLIQNFAPIVYLVGHGASSVNNPYYAGYDCGACAGRPGAVNARVFAYMANKPEVRALLQTRGLTIPASTFFVGAMHDTTRDEIEFYDEESIPLDLRAQHRENINTYHTALELNAHERSYRFKTVNSKSSLARVHQRIKKRSVSLFEPRPEWNHTDNALCIVGRNTLYNNLYLDKRPFINSYDYANDLNGILLTSVLNAAIPVCGGINLEYYFSRVDQHKLGAGSKLPHNVVGLFGINTGTDGDLRTGLPSQMIEIHDPVRILFIVEHFPEIVLKAIRSNSKLIEWVENEWILLVSVDPKSGAFFRFRNSEFEPYQPSGNLVKRNGKDNLFMDVISKKEPTIILT